jgi:hypothetical protein
MPKRSKGRFQHFRWASGTPRVEVEEGCLLRETFEAVFGFPSGLVVEVEVKAQPGRARVSKVTTYEHEEQGIAGLSVERVSMSQLLSQAVVGMAWLENRDRVTAMAAVRRAGRRRVPDDRLTDVAKAFLEGGIPAVKAAVNVEQRQAYRLVIRARDKGLLPEATR